MLRSINQRAVGWKSDRYYFVSESVYEIRIPFESQNASLITYSNNSYSNTAVATGDFVKRYTVGEVSLPFLIGNYK
jgi:hypothetical protein